MILDEKREVIPSLLEAIQGLFSLEVLEVFFQQDRMCKQMTTID
jgi:hypothetical protein